MIAIEDLIAVLDSIAANVDVFTDAQAIVAAAALDDAEQISTINDLSVQSDLTRAFSMRADLIAPASLYPAFGGQMLRRALDAHTGLNGGLDAFLLSEDELVHPNLNLIGFGINPRNLFPPAVVDPLARYDGTGAGTGTFTSVIDINSHDYGGADLEVVVEVMGADDRALTLTLARYDGSESSVDVTIPALASADDVVLVPGGRFMSVKAITSTGGTADDRLRVRTILERSL